MNIKGKNVAYIDGANLHKGVKNLGWKLDYRRFRVWLKDKFSVDRAYLFIGLIPENKDLYTRLQEMGYILVYKEVSFDGNGKVKGNCDADLVLRSVVDFYEGRFDNVLIVSSDGDYTSLVRFLNEKNKILGIISPAVAKKCSILLKKTGVKIFYIDNQKSILSNNKKAPDEDETS